MGGLNRKKIIMVRKSFYSIVLGSLRESLNLEEANKKAGTDNLTFTKSSDGSYYSVKAGNTSISGNLEIPSEYDGLPVKVIEKQGFKNCKKLTSVVIPEGITTIPKEAFQYCTSVKSIEFPSSITDIETNAFQYCSALTAINLPASLKNIGEDVFGCNSKVASITVDSANSVYHSEGNCCIKTTDNKVVFGCKTSVIPDYITSIGDYAFNCCTTLKSIKFPNGLTNIGKFAFNGCTGLKSIKLPTTLTSVEIGAFMWCTNLKGVELPQSLTNIGSNAFPRGVVNN